MLGHVGWCGSVKGTGDRIGGGETFNSPEDDGVFVAGAGEDQVAIEGYAAGGLVTRLVVKEGEKGSPVDEIVVDFGGGEMRVVEDDGNVDVFLWELGEGPLVDISDALSMKSEKIW